MLIGDKYRVIRPLKKGGMSRVYLAEDIRLRMKWAIKVIEVSDDYLTDSIIAEANVLRSIKHPNLVRISDIFKWENSVCLVMEYVEGKSLRDILRTNPCLAERNVYEFSLDLMHALRALHERKNPIIYRDMKPDNIMVRPDMSLCLIDFGTSKKYNKEESDSFALGTKGYAPPEQYKGITDMRSDIYSLGITMKKMAGDKADRAMSAVTKRAVNPDPSKRYRTVKEMEADLKRRKGFRKRMVIVLTVILSVFTVIAALYYGYREKKKTALVADLYRKTVEEGNEAMYNGDYSRAENCFTRAITEINGYEREAYLRLLSLYRKAGAPSDGLSRIDYYIDTGYGNTDRMDELLFECGVTAFTDLKDYKKAGSYFQRTDKKLFPEADHLFSISSYLSSFEKTPRDYLRSIKEFRDHTDTIADITKRIKTKAVYTDMCLTLSEDSSFREEDAIVLLDGYDQGKKLMKLMEENITEAEYELQALNMMSAICRLLGEKFPDKKYEYYKEAVSYMNKAEPLENEGNDPKRYLAMAKLYQGMGDDRNAGIFYKRAESAGDSADAYTEHMKFLESRRRYRELMKVYEEALSVNGIQKNSEFQKITKNMEKMNLLKG